jgi:hypothetical protein
LPRSSGAYLGASILKRTRASFAGRFGGQ